MIVRLHKNGIEKDVEVDQVAFIKTGMIVREDSKGGTIHTYDPFWCRMSPPETINPFI